MQSKIIDTGVLQKIIEKEFGLTATQFQATQGLIAANKNTSLKRGGIQVDKQNFLQLPLSGFDVEKFSNWLHKNIKLFHKIGKNKFNLPSVSALKKARQQNQQRGGSKLDLPQNILYLDELNSQQNSPNYDTIDKAGFDFVQDSSPNQSRIKMIQNMNNSSLSNYGTSEEFANEQQSVGKRNTGFGHQTNKTLDLSSGDPFYYIKKEQIDEYESKKDVDEKIDLTLRSIKKFPKLRQTVFGQIQANEEVKFQRSAQHGAVGSEASRMHLTFFKQRQRNKEKDLL